MKSLSIKALAACILGVCMTGSCFLFATGAHAAPGGEKAHQGTPRENAQLRAIAPIPDVVILTEKDQGQTVTLTPGGRAIVVLQENPTTGYTWAVTNFNEQVATLEGSNYILLPGSASGDMPVVGRGGLRFYTFIARQPGTDHLHFKSWRSWDGDDSIVEQFDVTIESVETMTPHPILPLPPVIKPIGPRPIHPIPLPDKGSESPR